jgi:heterodisulfide reductase subunit C
MAMVQLGFVEELLKSEDVWKCAQCLACKERCPRDVAPYDVIQALQNLAFKRNLFPKDYSALIDSLLKDGVVQKPRRVRIRKHPPSESKRTKTFEFGDRASLSLPKAKKPHEIAKFAIALKKALKGDEK